MNENKLCSHHNYSNADYANIRLVPRERTVASRQECNPATHFGNHLFKLPAFPANMESVLNEQLAVQIAQKGYFYVMHRYGINNVEFIKYMQKHKCFSSITIGNKEKDYELLTELDRLHLHPDYITIDVAYAYYEGICEMIRFIKQKFPNTFLIVGNIATVIAAEQLVEAGADALKVGIGPGYVCTTKLITGFSTSGWHLSACAEIKQAVSVPLILDGGARCPGDIAKAIHYGATMVMAGSLFSGFIENPGIIVQQEGISYKEFYGTTSQHSHNHSVFVEGRKVLVPLKGSIWAYFTSLENALKSSISYAGGNDITSLLYCTCKRI